MIQRHFVYHTPVPEIKRLNLSSTFSKSLISYTQYMDPLTGFLVSLFAYLSKRYHVNMYCMHI